MRAIGSRFPNSGGVTIRTRESPDGFVEHTYFLATRRDAPPNLDPDHPASLPLTAEEIQALGAYYLPPNDFLAAPVVVGEESNGIRLMVENVCSTDCPLDVQQIIHWAPPDGSNCADIMRGVPRSLIVRTHSGGFQERTYCIAEPMF
jgi:hypothetical protein